MLFCITRTFTPEKSSTFWTGLREFVRIAEAVLPIGEVDEADRRQLVGDVLAEGAIEHGVGLLLVGEEEGQVEDAEIGQDADEGRRGGDHHLLGAGPQGLRGLEVAAAERTAPEALQLHLPPDFSRRIGSSWRGRCRPDGRH